MATNKLNSYAITIIITIILFVIYFTVNKKRFSNKIIDNATSDLYHADMQHLIINLFSFILISPMETILGGKLFLLIIIFIWLVNTLIITLLQSTVPKFNRYSLGFSGVVIGLMVVYAWLLYKNKNTAYLNIGLLLLSIIPQFFSKGISFEGHLSGFVAGLIAIFAFGL